MNRLEADVERLEQRFCPSMARRLTSKAVERDLCAAIDHVLLHRSRTSHSCKCGYRMVWGLVEAGDCPQCGEVSADQELGLEEGEDHVTCEEFEPLEEEIEVEQEIKFALLQAAAILRATHEFTVKQAVEEALSLFGEIDKRFVPR